MAVEVYANQPSTTVTSGGTDAPASGTPETWTVASSASFPAASATGSPPTQFHVADTAGSRGTETIAVTNVSGTTWTVTRGAESTTPVAHNSGFTITQVVTAGALRSSATGVIVAVPLPTGATATDTPNVTAAITNLVAALTYGPATLQFQDGTYQIDSNEAVVQSVSNFAVTSSGRTVIEQAPNRSGLPNNTSGDLFIVADCTDFRVEGITFDGMRDTVSPLTPLTATASSGQPSVTVASGNGARYQAGQILGIFGGFGTSDANLASGWTTLSGATPQVSATSVTSAVIQSITPGGGSGGGDLITFTTNLTASFTQISSTPVSDGFGPYAYQGAYLTPYQSATDISVAGRTLSSEDQQNGLHLINCQRFTISRVTSRNVWESQIKLGTGFSVTSLTDSCQQGIISDCTCYHGYDQGISVWLSSNITVTGNVLNASGWGGVVLTCSDECTVDSNISLNHYYSVPNGGVSGYGIACEGGVRNQVHGNIIANPYADGITIKASPLGFGSYGTGAVTTSTFLEANTAAGTSVQVSSTTNLAAGGKYSLIDGERSEAVKVATIADGTHVTFTDRIEFSHASGIYMAERVAQGNVVTGNTISGPQFGNGMSINQAVRNLIAGNNVRGWSPNGGGGGAGISLGYGNSSLPTAAYLGGDGTTIEGNNIEAGWGSGIEASGPVKGLQIRGNKIHGIFHVASHTGHILLESVTDSVVDGNRISDAISAQGIYVNASGGGAGGTPARLTITNNLITRCALAGIQVATGDSLTITGNIVTSCGGNAGIDLQGVTRSSVHGNVSNSNSGAGIELENSGGTYCEWNRVTGNTTRDDGTGYNVTTGATWTQQHGIVEAGNSNYNLITGNESDSNGTDQLTTVGAATYTFANSISGTTTGYFPAALLPLDSAVADIQPVGAAPSAGSNGLPADSGHVHAGPASYAPADVSFVAWSYDPVIAGFTTSRVLTGGTNNLVGLVVRQTVTVSTVAYYLAAVGTSLTSSENLIGLISSAGTLLGYSADQTSTWAGSPGYKTATLTAESAGSLNLTPGLYWVTFVANGSATMPSLASSQNQNANLANGRGGATGARFATNGSGVTALGNITPGSNSQQAITWWAGLY